MILLICWFLVFIIFVQADRERAIRQQEYFAQLDEEDEPSSLATTTEGEHTIQVSNLPRS